MKTPHWLACLLLLPFTASAAEWQVVLLKPRGCSGCTQLEEILKRTGQMQQATLDDGAGSRTVAPIIRRNSGDLSAPEWQELLQLPGFDETHWHQRMAARSAMVLLKRDGSIVAAGDIADSADLRDARLPLDITSPDARRNPLSVRQAHSAHLSELFLRSWNLDWFYRVALHPELARQRSPAAWITANAQALADPLAASNVLLMSTASGAADNEIFNALRIEEIRDVLARSLDVGPGRIRVFYGSDTPHGANALELRDGRIGLIRREVSGASAFTPDAARRIFEAIRARPASRNLLVLVGHGNPEGAGMWASPLPLAPATLRALHEHGGGDDVLVSGNCFGGVMAHATSCGFFGARPDVVATGCQADAAEVAQSRDYLHVFFASLKPENRRAADTDMDGRISFAEAHWHASTDGDPRNVTYTSIDALADAHFDRHPQTLPAGMSVSEMRDLAGDDASGEAHTLRRLLAASDPALVLPLRDLAAQAERWHPGSGQPRPLAAQLARRLLFLQAQRDDAAELEQLQACENRSVAEFLTP